jgi:sulfite oxidase
MAQMGNPERSLQELYGDDPERADALVWGRRGALKGAALASMGAALGAAIPFAARMPRGLVPAALAQPTAGGQGSPRTLQIPGKESLILQGERPLNLETPETLLDDEVTPAEKMFVRNNGQVPEAPADPRAWTIRIEGEVNQPLAITVGELEGGGRFPVVTRRLQLECGGNGRSFFTPETRGNQWGNGAVSCAEWTGVRLRDLLRAAGLKEGARFTGHFGADPHLSGDPARQAISRGMRIEKALPRAGDADRAGQPQRRARFQGPGEHAGALGA